MNNTTICTDDGRLQYNKVTNKQSNKETKYRDNIVPSASLSSCAEEQGQSQLLRSKALGSVISEPARKVFNDMVEACIVTLYQKPEGRRKNKLSVTFNLTDKQKPEFISNLTDRWNDFQRHINDEEFLVWANEIRQAIRYDYNAKPLMGKLRQKNRQANIDDKLGTPGIESQSAVFVWEDAKEGTTKVIVRYKSFIHEFELNTEDLTKGQLRTHVKGFDYFRKPKVNDNTWGDEYV